MRGRGGTRLLARLIARQVWTDRGVVALLALVTAGTAFLAFAVPRQVEEVSTRALRAAVADVGPLTRGISGSAVVPPLESSGDAAAPYDALVQHVTEGPVRHIARWAESPEWDLRTIEWWMTGDPPRPGPGRHFILRAGSAWPERVRFVDGREPRTAELPPATRAAADAADRGDVLALMTAPPVRVEIALSARAAGRLELRAGDELVIGPRDGSALPELHVVVTGIFEPTDPADELWEIDPAALHPAVGESDTEGTFMIASAYLGVGALPALSEIVPPTSAATTLTVRVDIDPSTLRAADAPDLASGVRRATTELVGLPQRYDTQVRPTLGFASGLPEALEQYAQRRAPVVALAAVLLAGLLGCAAVVLFLASRLLLERRRPALALAVTRGASPGQGLGLLALEALLVAVPAAAAGAALAAATVPGRGGTLAVVLVVATALVPVLATPAAAWSQVAPRRPRTALVPVAGPGARRRLDAVLRRGRSAGEVLLLGGTVAAVAALVSRGVTAEPAEAEIGAVGASAVDPLVTVTPLLVGVSVAVLTHRALAWPLGLAVRRAARRRGLVGFLGLARAGRAGVLGASATAALTVALAVASLAAVTRATLADGAETASWRAVGADLRVTSGGLGQAQADALERVPGVEAATPVTLVRESPFWVIRPGLPGSLSPDERLTLVAVDPAALADVQRDVPGRPALPAAFADRMAEGSDGADALPVIVSAGLAGPGDDVRFEVGARRVRGTVVGAYGAFPGAPVDGLWLMTGVRTLRAAASAELSAQLLLARAPELADADVLPAATVTAVTRVVAGGTVTTPGDWRAESTSSALVRAVRDGVPVAVAAGGVLAALAVLLTLLAGGASRRRFVAHLRAMGLSGRQAAALVGLEVLPGAAAALVAGLLAGTGMALLVLPAADLRPLTGAVQDVGIVVGPWTLGAIGLGFAAVLAVGVLAAALEQRRVSPATAARLGDAE